MEAHLAAARLESAGVKTLVRDENMVMNDWLASNAVGGVRIDVADEDWGAARAVLELSPEAAGLLVCPHCGSRDVHVHVLSAFGALCVFFKLLIPLKRATVGCRNCQRTHSVPVNGQTSG